MTSPIDHARCVYAPYAAGRSHTHEGHYGRWVFPGEAAPAEARAAASRGVIHVDNRSTDGRALERAQAAMVRWAERGYLVAPMPASKVDHPYGRRCLICGPTRAELAALEAVAGLGARYDWVTSGMIEQAMGAALVPGGNSTPSMQPLWRAGLVRRVRYSRRYAYQLTDAGRAALPPAETVLDAAR